MNDNLRDISQTQKFSGSSEINYDERKKVRGLCGFRNQGNYEFNFTMFIIKFITNFIFYKR